MLQYDVFLSPDQARAVALQRYADSDAVLSTLVATRPLIQRLAALAGGLDLGCSGTCPRNCRRSSPPPTRRPVLRSTPD